jgi:hypothetical protein
LTNALAPISALDDEPHRFIRTTSRYSLGTTIVPSSALFMRATKVESLAKLFTHDLQGCAYNCVVAGGPCSLLSGLYGHEIRRSARLLLVGL